LSDGISLRPGLRCLLQESQQYITKTASILCNVYGIHYSQVYKPVIVCHSVISRLAMNYLWIELLANELTGYAQRATYYLVVEKITLVRQSDTRYFRGCGHADALHKDLSISAVTSYARATHEIMMK